MTWTKLWRGEKKKQKKINKNKTSFFFFAMFGSMIKARPFLGNFAFLLFISSLVLFLFLSFFSQTSSASSKFRGITLFGVMKIKRKINFSYKKKIRFFFYLIPPPLFFSFHFSFLSISIFFFIVFSLFANIFICFCFLPIAFFYFYDSYFFFFCPKKAILFSFSLLFYF